MKHRTAVIEFHENFFKNGFNTQEFIEVLNLLPIDTKILSFFDNSTTRCSGIVIEHNKYKETEESCVTPRIIINCKEQHGETESWIEYSLDESNALDPTYREYLAPCTQYNGVEFFKKDPKVMQEEINKFSQNMSIYGTTTVFIPKEKLSYSKPFFKFEEFLSIQTFNPGPPPSEYPNEPTKAPTVSLNTPNGQLDICEHDYKNYEGFTKSYRYCTKCDHKLE